MGFSQDYSQMETQDKVDSKGTNKKDNNSSKEETDKNQVLQHLGQVYPTLHKLNQL